MGQGLGGLLTLSFHVLRTHHPPGTSVCISNPRSSPEPSCVVFIKPHYRAMIAESLTTQIPVSPLEVGLIS